MARPYGIVCRNDRRVHSGQIRDLAGGCLRSFAPPAGQPFQVRPSLIRHRGCGLNGGRFVFLEPFGFQLQGDVGNTKPLPQRIAELAENGIGGLAIADDYMGR